MSTLAERLAQRAADFAALPVFNTATRHPKPETAQPNGPVLHRLRRDGTTTCGAPSTPFRITPDTPDCQACGP